MSTITLSPRVSPAHSTTSARAVRSGRGQVRLTRRGRAVVFLVALAAVVAAAVWLAAGSAATKEEGVAHVEVVTVAPGDTLWGIASAAAAEGEDDVRDMMQRIQQMNELDGSVVYVGQDLRVPAADAR